MLFLNAIKQSGTDEQIARWEPLANTMRLTGCFAMTELGHGSYVPGLETTATYDRSREVFLINTPVETATKWWIGAAAQTALICSCFARLIIDGKDHGVYIFLVPLRNPSTFDPFPGVTIGDCGSKMGRNGIDNGWIQFSNVLIPRDHMLMRYAQVTRDGAFIQPTTMQQLAYGPLVQGRILVMASAVETAKRALILAIRYSVVRRQFPNSNAASILKSASTSTSTSTMKEFNPRELQILDYATHKRRLLPLLAETYAMNFTYLEIARLGEDMMIRLAKNDVSLLSDLHPLAAGFKAFSAWFTLSTIEECRQSCGGLGYSSYSGFPSMLADFAVNCTWEGDNTVMAQQTARYLVKSLQSAMEGKSLKGSVEYLCEAPIILSSKWTSKNDLSASSCQKQAYNYMAIRAIVDASLKLKMGMEKGVTLEEAWNQATVELVQCSKAHCYYFMFQCMTEAVASTTEDESMRDILQKLNELFVWHSLSTYFLSYLMKDGFMTGADLSTIQNRISQLCDEIRDQAIPITDAFNFSDFLLRSPIGRYDGNVYRGYFDRVRQYPNSQKKPSYWKEAIYPLHFPEKLNAKL